MAIPLPDVKARLDGVVTRIRGLGIEADIDVALVNVPGVWVKWLGLDLGSLDDGYVKADLVLMVEANATADVLVALQDLADEVVEEFGRPDGDPRTQSTVVPDGPVPLPSLVLPYLIA